MHLHHGRALLWLFMLGAILGTALDAFHVYSYVQQYTRPAFFGLAWWVPLLFGSAAVAIGYSHPLVDPIIHNSRRPRRLITSIAELSWLLLAYLIAASPISSLAKTALLILIYFNFWLLTGRGWQNLLLSLDSHYGYARRDDPRGGRSILIPSTRHTRRSLLAPFHVCLCFPGSWRPGTVPY